MNGPYYREFFNRFLSVHAKTKKELIAALYFLDEVEDTIDSLHEKKNTRKECGEFIAAVIKNNNLEVEIVYNGKYLIDYDNKTKTYTEF